MQEPALATLPTLLASGVGITGFGARYRKLRIPPWELCYVFIAKEDGMGRILSTHSGDATLCFCREICEFIMTPFRLLSFVSRALSAVRFKAWRLLTCQSLTIVLQVTIRVYLAFIDWAIFRR